jgi:signal peptidase I
VQEPLHEYTPLDIDLAERAEGRSCLSRLWVFFVETLETIILAAVLFAGINFVSARIRVDGRSMEPTFHHGEYVIVNKLAYRFDEFERGDVIVFPYPFNEEEDFIKRIIGLPGDRVTVRGGQVYVNDRLLDEPYISAQPLRDFEETLVPESQLFVMGDNRNDSSDSRSWGTLEMDAVIGEAWFVYWPLSDLGLVEHVDTVFAQTQ